MPNEFTVSMDIKCPKLLEVVKITYGSNIEKVSIYDTDTDADLREKFDTVQDKINGKLAAIGQKVTIEIERVEG